MTTQPYQPPAPAAESAKLLKAALRKRFPSCTFSVRLSRGTAYGCASVGWTDGPTVDLVNTVVAPFQGEGFDGMTDCSYHIETSLPDGRRSGLRLINTSRRLSTAFARRLAGAVARFYGIKPPEITETASGYWQVVHECYDVANTRASWSTLIYRASHDRSSVTRRLEVVR